MAASNATNGTAASNDTDGFPIKELSSKQIVRLADRVRDTAPGSFGKTEILCSIFLELILVS